MHTEPNIIQICVSIFSYTQIYLSAQFSERLTQENQPLTFKVKGTSSHHLSWKLHPHICSPQFDVP